MIKTRLKVIAILLSGYLCLQTYYLKGIYVGYLNRSQLSNIPDSIKNNTPSFYILQADPYYHLPDFHFYITFLLLLFIIGQLIKKEILSQSISLIAISLSLLGYLYIYNLKSNYLLNEDQYLDLMRMTLSTDLTHVWLSLAVLIYQIILTFYYWLYEKRKDSTKINSFS